LKSPSFKYTAKTKIGDLEQKFDKLLDSPKARRMLVEIVINRKINKFILISYEIFCL